VKVSQDLESLFPAVLRCEPTRRAREEEKTQEENETGNGLDTPGDSEGGGALGGVLRTPIDKGRPILDEVLNEDTPGDGPLLEGNDSAADLLCERKLMCVSRAIHTLCTYHRRNLSLIDRNNRRTDTNSPAGNKATNAQESDAVGRGL
jgi:hypothetical protein